MFASIHSFDDAKRSLDIKTSGKTMKMASSAPSITHDGNTLRITASDIEYYRPQDTTFSRSAPRDIHRELTLELAPEELIAILNAALKANLIHASFTVESPAVKEQIIE